MGPQRRSQPSSSLAKGHPSCPSTSPEQTWAGTRGAGPASQSKEKSRPDGLGMAQARKEGRKEGRRKASQAQEVLAHPQMRPECSPATCTPFWEGKGGLGTGSGHGSTALAPYVARTGDTQTWLTDERLEVLSAPPLSTKHRLWEENESSFTSFPIYPELQIYQWGSF